MAGPILVAVNDLFFSSKLDAVARGLGVSIRCLPTCQQVLEAGREEFPLLFIVDLNSAAGDPVGLVRSLKGDPRTQGIPIVGFLSHVEVELRQQALAAGCDEVLARSAFVGLLPKILRSFGAPK
jgi:CheY-like chemotaxis protein